MSTPPPAPPAPRPAGAIVRFDSPEWRSVNAASTITLVPWLHPIRSPADLVGGEPRWLGTALPHGGSGDQSDWPTEARPHSSGPSCPRRRRGQRHRGGTLGAWAMSPRFPSSPGSRLSGTWRTQDRAARGQGASTGRFVHKPGRWSRVVVVVVVGLLAGGLLWWAGDGEPGDDDGTQEPAGITRARARATRVAFAGALLRLGQAGSFAYRGSVHAAGESPFRPGAWTAADVTVEGAVLLQHALTRDVAVDATGRAVETVTSGPHGVDPHGMARRAHRRSVRVPYPGRVDDPGHGRRGQTR